VIDVHVYGTLTEFIGSKEWTALQDDCRLRMGSKILRLLDAIEKVGSREARRAHIPAKTKHLRGVHFLRKGGSEV